jgi:hypothetical protein
VKDDEAVTVRIERLEVQFDVVGDDEKEFVRLFAKHLPPALAARDEHRRRRQALDAERVLGDRGGGSR